MTDSLIKKLNKNYYRFRTLKRDANRFAKTFKRALTKKKRDIAIILRLNAYY